MIRCINKALGEFEDFNFMYEFLDALRINAVQLPSEGLIENRDYVEYMAPTTVYVLRSIVHGQYHKDFKSVEDALNKLQTMIEDMEISEEDAQTYFIVKVIEEEVPNAIAKFIKY
jgi:hypothetical protein